MYLAQPVNESVQRHAGHLPAPPGATATETSAAAKSTESSSAKSPTAKSSTQATKATESTAAPHRHRQYHRCPHASPTAAASRTTAPASVPHGTNHKVSNDGERDNQPDRDSPARWSRCRRLCHQARVELEAELPLEGLRDPHSRDLGTAAVATACEVCHHFIADSSSRTVGNEPFGTESSGDVEAPSSIWCRFLWHDQDDDTGVTTRITYGRGRAHSPFPADLERHVTGLATTEISERDERNLSSRATSNIRGNALDALPALGWKHIGEVVHVSARRGKLGCLQRQQQTDSLRRQMQHPSLLLLLARTPLAALAMVFAVACGGPNAGEIHVVIDSTQASAALEVVAVPFDPAALRTVATDGVASDSMEHVLALSDSLRGAERRFQDERAFINSEVISMRGRDRTTREYAAAHAALTRRITTAESLRAERDAIRARRQALADALRLSSSDEAWSARIPWARVDSASRAVRRAAITASPVADTITLRASTGTWWVTAGRVGDYIASDGTRVDVRRGVRTTVRLDNGS